MEYHFIELPKYREVKKFDEIINKWLYAIRNAEKFINNPEKLPDLIKKEATIMKAIQKMQKAAADPKVKAILEYREKAELDYINRISSAEKRGKEMVAIKLLSMGMNLDDISSATGLSKTDIQKLKQ
jgi:predicted transposase/invertase (TIGR01784 family)